MLIGIDLGTTNSAVAIWRGGAAERVPNAVGAVLTPSAVSIDKSGQSFIGAAALDRTATHPADTATSFKRLMGTDRKTRLSALVLMSLIKDAANHLGERPTAAVITVPAYFNDKQRQATRRAGELAGPTVRRLINEPTAAALAWRGNRRCDPARLLIGRLSVYPRRP